LRVGTNRGLRGLAEAFPNLAERIERVVDRIVDLLPIARENYYHPDMMGSWSIKAVLPAIAPDLSYGDLDVADGGMAQDAFAAILDPAIAPDLREQLIESLLIYCKQDTYAMVVLERVLSARG
jgi:hypothetical protein